MQLHKFCLAVLTTNPPEIKPSAATNFVEIPSVSGMLIGQRAVITAENAAVRDHYVDLFETRIL
jgi:hypothetical protein